MVWRPSHPYTVERAILELADRIEKLEAIGEDTKKENG
jgi:hypothetical protein